MGLNRLDLAVVSEYFNRVPVTIQGAPAEVEERILPKHKKNPDVGEKKTVYSSAILIDQEDAKSFEDQEEVGYTIFSIFYSLYTIFLPDNSYGLGQRNHSQENSRRLR